MDPERVNTGKILLTILSFLAGIIAVAAAIQLVLCRQTRIRMGMLRYGAIYSNCGFAGLLLAQAILGSAGVVHASACVMAFNLLT